MRWAVVGPDHAIRTIMEASRAALVTANCPPDCTAQECPDPQVTPGAWAWSADAGFFALPVAVPDLDEVRATTWARVKSARDRAEWWGCSTLLGRADTDPESQRKISGAVQMAMIAMGAGQPFSIGWTMQDNSTAGHDGPAMIAMGVAVGQHVAACHAVALAKRGQIEAAADAEAVNAIDLEGGWPDAP